ncbi:DUF305 domain-containing protein [Noviherbaspirillum sp. CPCC 100848]|uniref:DUF305 domain-containing protein n=1 Tax=Noviherbaspirillum album TaxID=3080276 RepID=A0ABU6JDB6_9BURK|nr:DUF305 domain-containing protein [Noviherbaspirillum sp. CPCC 100848]MEC4721637.1 DUF305 domain-containing protein [Noviherbaspirillum sp. CPCC 100848]
MQIARPAAALLCCLALTTPALGQHASHSGAHDQGQGQMHGMQHGSMKSSPEAAKAEFDHQFIDTMAIHHQSAVEMAQLVEKRSGRAELKQMAKKVIDDQQTEIKQLREWKQQWYAGRGDAVNMKMPGMAESMKNMSMDKLSAANGKAFDAMFIDMMTRHHRGAVKMAQDAMGKLKHDELKNLARNVIDTQKQEIDQMAAWKKEWKLASR